VDKSQFIKDHLEGKSIGWKELDGKIVIDNPSYLDVEWEYIPEGTIFGGEGITFQRITKLPKNVKFLNWDTIYFLQKINLIGEGTLFHNGKGLVFNRGIGKIEEGVIFKNAGDIIIRENLGTFSKGVKFDNQGHIGGSAIDEIVVYGISNKSLLNCMAKQLYRK
jgi:hypothetical protein